MVFFCLILFFIHTREEYPTFHNWQEHYYPNNKEKWKWHRQIQFAVRQPDDHIGWATLMFFKLIYPTHPRINPWSFREKILRIGGVENLRFFWAGQFLFFFASSLWRLHLWDSKNGSKFWWLPWFAAPNNSCQIIWPPLHCTSPQHLSLQVHNSCHSVIAQPLRLEAFSVLIF